MDFIIHSRNTILASLYKGILKPFFFSHDPEEVHDRMVKVGQKLGKYSLGRFLISASFNYKNPILSQDILGMTFDNPIGLSAGFDKNAELTEIVPSVGFGFAEVGSVTGSPCEGNPKPRLWRLPHSKSLMVHYGLKNDGCIVVSKRLEYKDHKIPIGISVAMTNCAENIELAPAIEDITKAFKIMEPLAHYLTVNISCPNTQGGQPFMNPEKLDSLFNSLDTIPTQKPIFIKLSPDVPMDEIDRILDVARKHRIHGIICTNLTKKRDNPKIADENIPNVGGMSGKLVEDLSDALLSHIYKKEGNKFVLIGSGGVFSAEDAYKKIRAGASLVQMITGMIYEGPQIVGEINRGLVTLLKRDGFKNVKDAIGTGILKGE
jgi:dihydroorotate dehydrogenase